MKIRLLGDYYVWYCDWCDSRNSTPWTRIEAQGVCCAACQQQYELTSAGDLLPYSQIPLPEAV